MKKTVERQGYLDWLDQFRDRPLIKVLTGMRRVGKSTILNLFARRLRRGGVPASRIVMLNFEEMENEPLREAKALHEFLKGKIVKGRTTYMFLDEIQRVERFEEVLDSLYVKKGVDLYVTGSTANLFSSEIATMLTGRYVEVNVLPFSFDEGRRRQTGRRERKAQVHGLPRVWLSARVVCVQAGIAGAARIRRIGLSHDSRKGRAEAKQGQRTAARGADCERTAFPASRPRSA